MPMRVSKSLRTFSASSILALAISGAAIVPGSAQVVYQTDPYTYGYSPFLSDPSPYNQAYGARPSFQIVPTPDPYAPAVRVVERCLYPNGWNVTDFSRDVNGIPPDIDHTCPATGRVRVRARY